MTAGEDKLPMPKRARAQSIDALSRASGTTSLVFLMIYTLFKFVLVL